ncbi:DUF512 domain-containing protein [candidate division WOR-3 bacterium]|nr:DUF512 domain-containing protein [candidate division WOR-3 bacterium]
MRIAKVEMDSPAYRYGIREGDSIISINGHKIVDNLSLSFHQNAGKLIIKYIRNGKMNFTTVRKYTDNPLGVEGYEILRRCSNNCIFCFEKQLPLNARATLRERDDDYILSFLTGSYITMTNFTDFDRYRIINEKLSPLYLSIHATDSKTRQFLIGNDKSKNIIEEMKYFINNGIKFHTQFVICPGINDSNILEQSIRDMEELISGILSIAIIPVGITKFRDSLYPLRMQNREEAKNLINMVGKSQEYFLRNYKRRVIYAADELFIISGDKIPDNTYYDDYPQYDNGIGLIRTYLNEIEQINKWNNKSINKRIALVTGNAFKYYISKYSNLLKEKYLIDADIVSITNSYFGNSVNVASLISFEDIINGIRMRNNHYDLVVLPPDIINNDGLSIDDHSIKYLNKNLKCDIMIANRSFVITTQRLIEV